MTCRHERPTDPDDPLADQNIKDRFYGANDPVAEKLMRRADAMPKLEQPDDKTVTTLYVGGLGDKVTEENLRWVAGITSQTVNTSSTAHLRSDLHFFSCRDEATKKGTLE